MGYALIEKSTSRVLEYQSRATPGTLLKNIENNPQYGFTLSDVEECLVEHTMCVKCIAAHIRKNH